MAMLFRVESGDMMQMGRNQVEHIQEERARHDTCHHQPPLLALLKGRND